MSHRNCTFVQRFQAAAAAARTQKLSGHRKGPIRHSNTRADKTLLFRNRYVLECDNSLRRLHRCFACTSICSIKSPIVCCINPLSLCILQFCFMSVHYSLQLSYEKQTSTLFSVHLSSLSFIVVFAQEFSGENYFLAAAPAASVKWNET